MRIGFLSTAMALLTGLGTALGQAPATPSDPSARPAAGQPDSNGAKAQDPSTGPVTAPDVGNGPGEEPGVGLQGGDPNLPDTSRYVRFEYLLWRIKDGPLPPLNLVLPFTSTGLNDFASTVSIPNTTIEYAGRNGGRLTGGCWLDPEKDLGIEASYFQFERKQEAILSNQAVNLPVTVTIIQNITTTTVVAGVAQTTTEQVPIDVELPGQVTTSVVGTAGPTNFWGTSIDLMSRRAIFGAVTFDLTAGFRYINLDERFNLTETISLTTAAPNTLVVTGAVTTATLPTIPPALTGISTLFTTQSLNSVVTHNHFFGGEVGTNFEWWLGRRLFFSGWGKLGVGGMIQNVNMANSTITINPNVGTIATPGGLLTPLVGGVSQSHTRYAVVPEFNINLGYQVTPNIRSMIGFNFLYLSSVARPGDQFSFGSSATNFNIAGTGSAVAAVQPTINYHDTDFWAQGLTAGFEFRW